MTVRYDSWLKISGWEKNITTSLWGTFELKIKLLLGTGEVVAKEMGMSWELGAAGIGWGTVLSSFAIQTSSGFWAGGEKAKNWAAWQKEDEDSSEVSLGKWEKARTMAQMITNTQPFPKACLLFLLISCMSNPKYFMKWINHQTTFILCGWLAWAIYMI